ncbi:uncharacterized protein A4U43_C03F10230 [Asparagus officinalis]|uniref:Uncharacterized protein n=1 Tax=Asparagus officinalis TaxID=4686 RepID=A0A5P1F8T2_ASPOF|nr:uncharacterized protein A4U43_C03F10230 [Asparagus officinalis]
MKDKLRSSHGSRFSSKDVQELCCSHQDHRHDKQNLNLSIPIRACTKGQGSLNWLQKSLNRDDELPKESNRINNSLLSSLNQEDELLKEKEQLPSTVKSAI